FGTVAPRFPANTALALVWQLPAHTSVPTWNRLQHRSGRQFLPRGRAHVSVNLQRPWNAATTDLASTNTPVARNGFCHGPARNAFRRAAATPVVAGAPRPKP